MGMIFPSHFSALITKFLDNNTHAQTFCPPFMIVNFILKYKDTIETITYFYFPLLHQPNIGKKIKWFFLSTFLVLPNTEKET